MSKEEMAPTPQEPKEQKETLSSPPQQSHQEGFLSTEEFERELEKLRPKLINKCVRKLGQKPNARDIAQDIVQDTLTNAVRYRKNFRGDSSLETWITHILFNKISDYFSYGRADALRWHVEPNPDISETQIENARESHANPEETLLEKENTKRLTKAVEELSTSSRDVFKLSMEGLKPKEIARLLNKSNNAVRQSLVYARRVVAKKLGIKNPRISKNIEKRET